MNYWYGIMDWPIDGNWKCETCNEWSGLTWGIVHAECRCDKCHSIYTMRDNSKEERPLVTTPISRLKKEYQNAAPYAWEHYQIPLDDMTDTHWNYAFEAIEYEG